MPRADAERGNGYGNAATCDAPLAVRIVSGLAAGAIAQYCHKSMWACSGAALRPILRRLMSV
jgi:hypothetical protein